MLVISLNIEDFDFKASITIANKTIEQILDEAFGCYLYVCHFLIYKDNRFEIFELKLGYAMLLESYVKESSYYIQTSYYYWVKRFRKIKPQIAWSMDKLRKAGFIRKQLYKGYSDQPLTMLLEKYIKESKELYSEGEKRDLLGFRYSKVLPVEQGQDDEGHQ